MSTWLHIDSSPLYARSVSRELTAALNYGVNKVRFPAPVRVGSQVRATVAVMRAEQKTSGLEAEFALTYEIDGDKRPACVADVIVLYP